jgi:release factor glutamine methyltransferase
LSAGLNRDSGSLLDWGKKQLRKAGIEDYATSAETLLGKVVKSTRSELLLNPQKLLNSEAIAEYKRLITERAKRVPLQYLIDYVEFYNVKIKCDPRALIPRPETEILVEIVIEKLAKFKSPKILDIGTGSGNIAITLAKNIAGCFVVAVDISTDALDLAKQNAVINDVTHSIEFEYGDIFDRGYIEGLGNFDCIVSNPPYVAESEKDQLQPEVLNFEPGIALFSTGDPLRFFRVITETAPRILKPGGLLAFESALGQAAAVAEMMSTEFTGAEIFKDLAGIDRVITGILAK